MKLCFICHGNIARSQILHRYVADYANKASLDLDLFSCGTAPKDYYPEADRLLAEVQTELSKRGLKESVKRDILDDASLEHLRSSDYIFVADDKRKQEVLVRLGESGQTPKVMLFYQFIGEGPKDFVDTFDANKGAQDPERFSRCFDELARIAKSIVEKIRTRDSRQVEFQLVEMLEGRNQSGIAMETTSASSPK